MKAAAEGPLTRRAALTQFAASVAILAITSLLALTIGGGGVSLATLFAPETWIGNGPAGVIVRGIRLPRIILAASAGGALAVAGVLFQALLRNPLAEPYILGVSNGCAVGAILGLLTGAGAIGVPLLSISGGVLAVSAVLMLGRESYGRSAESMLLGGVMVGAIGAAAIFLLLHLLGPQVRSAIQWMLGDLGSATPTTGYFSGILFLALLIGVWWGGDAMNALALGDDEAFALGYDVDRLRVFSFVLASAIVGLTVAFCGAIGFVGLVVPHILRRIVGPDHRVLLPLSVVGGAIFTIICDTIARSLIPSIDASGGELPIGAVTALAGAPIFIYLLRRT